MKKETSKHDHRATKCLKVALFTIVMLLPVFYIVIQCLPYVYNQSFTTNQSIFDQAETMLLSSNLLTWTSNTLLYSGINAMMTQLNITSNMLIKLLTYWLMLTTIYVVIDIVLEMFIFITHWLNDKTI